MGETIMDKYIDNGKTIYSDYPTRHLYSDESAEKIEKLGICRHFPKNYILHEAGDMPECCYFIRRGRAITFDFISGGEERIYEYINENSFILEASLMLNEPSYIYLKTTEPSDLICIDTESLISGMHEDAVLMTEMFRSLSYKFISSMDQVRQTITRDATWKICNLLLIFADRFGESYEGKMLIHEKISQQMISDMLGIDRVSTARIMKSLEEMNLIGQQDGYYYIPDISGLREYEDSCSFIHK